MRILTDHIVDGDSANSQLTITVIDEPGAGGANHMYAISFGGYRGVEAPPLDAKGYVRESISFQKGPIKENGVNGLTQEALLAIIIDRLKSFQAGPFACEDNALALDHSKAALTILQNRTRSRIARGVEGTHEK